MPVSRISRVGVRSSTLGAGRWMGQRSPPSSRSPAPSIGSPSRLKIRPRVTSPTGTVIGPPVSFTRVPRARPSGAPPPREPEPVAFLIVVELDLEGVVDLGQVAREGHLHDHALDLFDGPDALLRCGCGFQVVLLNSCLGEPFGPGDDLHDLLRDLRLALAVGRESEVVYQLGGVV